MDDHDAPAAPDAAPDAAPAAGWLLVANRQVLDVGPMLEQFGTVYRHPVAAGPAAAAMAPGQPCFLLRTDPAVTIGLWAIGEVVGPCAPIDDAFAHPASGRVGEPADGDQLYVELDLLPLQKAIALPKLADEAGDVLGALLASLPDPGHPVPLGRDAVRALEGIEFWLEEPSDDQRAALDRQLAAEDDAGI